MEPLKVLTKKIAIYLRSQEQELAELKDDTEIIKKMTEKKARQNERKSEELERYRKKLKSLLEKNPGPECELEHSSEAGAGESGKEMFTASPKLKPVLET